MSNMYSIDPKLLRKGRGPTIEEPEDTRQQVAPAALAQPIDENGAKFDRCSFGRTYTPIKAGNFLLKTLTLNTGASTAGISVIGSPGFVIGIKGTGRVVFTESDMRCLVNPGTIVPFKDTDQFILEAETLLNVRVVYSIDGSFDMDSPSFEEEYPEVSTGRTDAQRQAELERQVAVVQAAQPVQVAPVSNGPMPSFGRGFED